MCSSIPVDYEWDTIKLGYWFPLSLWVCCWWVWGHQNFQMTTSSHEQPYVCRYVSHEKLFSDGCVSTRYRGDQGEGKLIHISPKSNAAFSEILPWPPSPYGTSKVTLISQSILTHILLLSSHTHVSTGLLSNDKLSLIAIISKTSPNPIINPCKLTFDPICLLIQLSQRSNSLFTIFTCDLKLS